MSVHGSIDHRILGQGSANSSIPVSEAFVALNIFMSSSWALAAGVERIAYNAANGGAVINWWDQAGAVGNNAWACYKFASASTPFYLLVQWSNGTFGSSPGNPGQIMGGNANWQATDTGGLGFAVALREDGASPWNGTTNNNGLDTKGSQVWTSGSSRLFVFPRSNNVGGSFNTNKENTAGFCFNKTNDSTSIKYSGARVHYIIDEENFLALNDNGYDGSYAMFYFGRFDRRPDITSSLPPYVMLSTSDSTTTPLPQYGTSLVYGTVSSAASQEGGVIYPLTGSPGIPYGVRGVSLDIAPNFLGDNRFHPNSGFYQAKYDTFPIFLAINESPTFGFIGRISFFNMIFGLPSGATDINRARAVFGNNVHASIKMICPWDGSSSPGQSADRVGRQF